MKTFDTLRRAGRSLKQAKIRTLLTSMAIGVGAFTITLSLAAGEGGREYTNTLIQNNGDANNLSVIAKQEKSDTTPQEYGASGDTTPQGLLGDSDIKKVQAIQDVASITPSYNVDATYMTRDGSAKKYETSVSIKSDRTAIPLAAGSLTDNQVASGKVVVPQDYLGVLGFKNAQDAIGKTITVHFEKPAQFVGQRQRESIDKIFTVAAVDQKSNTVLHYQTALRISPDDGKSIYEFQTADQPNKDQYFMINVRVRDGADAKAVQKSIEDAGYTVFSLQDVQQTLFQFINIVQWGTAGFGALAILASIFGIINTQYISVLERTQQIGLMKALGMRSRDVAALFRFEAAWIGFLGGAIGVSLALIAGTVCNPIIQKALDLSAGTNLLVFQPLVILGLMTALILIAITAGYFPARKAAKLDPIEALRTE